MRVTAKKNVRSLHMELSMIKDTKASLEVAMTAISKELSTARVERATLRWNRDEVLLKMKTLETGPGF